MEAVVAQSQKIHGVTGSWWHRKDVRKLNFLLVGALIVSATNGYDGSMLNGLQSLPPWENYFNHPHGSTLGLYGSIQNIGSLAAIPISPFLADGLGRRMTILIGCLIMILGVAIQTAAQSFGMFVGARACIGFGLQFAQSAAPMLVAEVSYPTQRAAITSIFNSLWYVGAVLAGWITLGTFYIDSTWSWRIPSLMQGIPSVITLCTILSLPESPRWLLSKGRDAEAVAVLAKYHAMGDESDPLVAFEVAEIKEALKLEDEARKSTSYLSLLNTRGNRKRFMLITAIAFFSQWSGNGLVSYYNAQILSQVGITSPALQLLINAVLACFNTIIAVGAAVFVEQAGRRRLFITSNAGMLFFWSIWTGLAASYARDGNVKAGKAVVGMIFGYYAFYDIAYSPLLVSYTVEILPFRLRARGVAYMNFCVCASLVFNQYINPIARQHIGWKYYLVYVGWLVFELIFVIAFVVETKGRTIEETAMLFDGEDSHLRAVAEATVVDEFGHVGPRGTSDVASDFSSKTPTSEKQAELA